jgi:hypothetical protein
LTRSLKPYLLPSMTFSQSVYPDVYRRCRLGYVQI